PPEQLRPELPPPLADLLLQLLAKDPKQRPAATEAVDRLEGIGRQLEQPAATVERPPPEAGPPSPSATMALDREARGGGDASTPPGPRWSRRPWVLGLGVSALALVGFLALAGTLGWFHRETAKTEGPPIRVKALAPVVNSFVALDHQGNFRGEFVTLAEALN